MLRRLVVVALVVVFLLAGGAVVAVYCEQGRLLLETSCMLRNPSLLGRFFPPSPKRKGDAVLLSPVDFAGRYFSVAPCSQMPRGESVRCTTVNRARVPTPQYRRASFQAQAGSGGQGGLAAAKR